MSSTGRGRPDGTTRGVGSGFAGAVVAAAGGGVRAGALAEPAAIAESDDAGSGAVLADGSGVSAVTVVDATAEGNGAGAGVVDAVEGGPGASEWWVA